MRQVDEPRVLVQLEAELVSREAQDRGQGSRHSTGVLDEVWIGHHCLLGDRLGQHLTVSVIDPATNGGDRHRLGQFGAGERGIALVGEFLNCHQSEDHGPKHHEEQNPQRSSSASKKDDGAHGVVGGVLAEDDCPVLGTGSATFSGTEGRSMIWVGLSIPSCRALMTTICGADSWATATCSCFCWVNAAAARR